MTSIDALGGGAPGALELNGPSSHELDCGSPGLSHPRLSGLVGTSNSPRGRLPGHVAEQGIAGAGRKPSPSRRLMACACLLCLLFLERTRIKGLCSAFFLRQHTLILCLQPLDPYKISLPPTLPKASFELRCSPRRNVSTVLHYPRSHPPRHIGISGKPGACPPARQCVPGRLRANENQEARAPDCTEPGSGKQGGAVGCRAIHPFTRLEPVVRIGGSRRGGEVSSQARLEAS